jgi:hypothetical protein
MTRRELKDPAIARGPSLASTLDLDCGFSPGAVMATHFTF